MTKREKPFYLYALLGYPLGHTLSPPMHMAALKAVKCTGIYMPFEIAPKEFLRVMKKLGSFPFAGCNVTVPYKEKIMPFLDAVTPEARIIGAVNTICFGKKRIGHNTDAYGFSRSLKEDLKYAVRGKTMLLIGAGGAARACMYVLCKEGAQKVYLADVDKKKAEMLRVHFKRYFKKTNIVTIAAKKKEYTDVLKECQMLVNATPVGLKKKDREIITADMLPKQKFCVYDLIYNPAKTKLLRLAQRKKLPCANGLGMLLHQGARAFELWTKKKAPVNVMKKALLTSLGRR